MNDLSNRIQTVLEKSSSPLILTWKSKKIEGALITKIGDQRYLGLVRQDKKGKTYWKYHLLTKVSETAAPPPSPVQEGEVEKSDQVKKFREKYGKPNNPK